MEVPVHLDEPTAQVPRYAHGDDAGCDLYASETVVLEHGGGRGIVSTGMSLEIPVGYGGFILPRSGLAIKHGVTCVNAPGLVDPGYRGEIRVALINLDRAHDYTVHVGDRIAQLVIMAVSAITFRVVDDLSDSTRGIEGFGSSGR